MSSESSSEPAPPESEGASGKCAAHPSGSKQYRDEQFAPDVDHKLLYALVRKELAEDLARSVYRLIHSFKSWDDAHARILIEEFQRTEQGAPRTPPEIDGSK